MTSEIQPRQTQPWQTQPWQIADLSLAELLKKGKAVERGHCNAELRLGILGDCATQHYSQCLAAALKLRGIWPEIHEAEFDSIQQETVDGGSPLFRHRPKAVVLFNCVQKLEERYAQSTQHDGFVQQVLDEMLEVWDRLLAGGVETILQHNFCLPMFRPFGNFSVASRHSLLDMVMRLNAALTERAQANGAIRIVDTESQAAFLGKRQWLDERLWCQAKQALSPRFLPPLAKSVSDVIAERMGRSVKCIILDLDNTLWGGVLGDVGFDGIEIGEVSNIGLVYQRFQNTLLQLRQRGVILAISSKNDESNVRRVLAEHPDMVLRESDFVKISANFNDKAGNIREIQAALNISLDSMVFIDDSAFERDFVRTALPELQVPEMPEDPADFLAALTMWNLFEVGSSSAEDGARTAFYQANVTRQVLQEKAGDLPAYLRALGMVADIRPFDGFTAPRAHQLFQRSNQFNLTTIRYSEAELKTIAQDPDCDTLTLRLQDRLGDNGIVAAVVARAAGEALRVDSWIMSCRVLGRRVEEATLDVLARLAQNRGCKRLIGEYRPTTKNAMVAELYAGLGFAHECEEGGAKFFRLEISSYRRRDDLPIEIRFHEIQGRQDDEPRTDREPSPIDFQGGPG
jgi:FkbH-like protein